MSDKESTSTDSFLPQNVENIEPFTCEKCEKNFSGIWKHYKCKDCDDFRMCSSCYFTFPHPHGVRRLGRLFKGDNVSQTKKEKDRKNRETVRQKYKRTGDIKTERHKDKRTE